MVTGLNNPAWQMWPIVNRWRLAGLSITVFDPKWKNGRPFRIKFHRLLNLIDKKAVNEKVSLVGISAGGSMVLNAFLKRQGKIDKVITVCSQLRRSQTYPNRTLESSKAFGQSISRLEKHYAQLGTEELKHIMTVRSMLGDELVPSDTAALRGAHNIMVPTGEHLFSIFCALTFFSFKLVRFIWKEL